MDTHRKEKRGWSRSLTFIVENMGASGIAFLISMLGLMFASSCSHNPSAFDEGKWRKQVEGQSVEKLYAAHFSDGHYGNPWMPMQHGGFWRLLKWRFAGKAQYSEEEQNYQPNSSRS